MTVGPLGDVAINPLEDATAWTPGERGDQSAEDVRFTCGSGNWKDRQPAVAVPARGLAVPLHRYRDA